MGGFHLPSDGGIYEEAIEPTLRDPEVTTRVSGTMPLYRLESDE
jgi:hypothetical protein